MKIRTGIGQDSHKFDVNNKSKKLILGGVVFDNCDPLKGNSDADVVLHSLTNAISGITGENVIGKTSDIMCIDQGITDSKKYLKLALKYLSPFIISHVSISIECSIPRISPKIDLMKRNIANFLRISKKDVGITVTSGEGLTSFGKGKGIQVISIVTSIERQTDENKHK